MLFAGNCCPTRRRAVGMCRLSGFAAGLALVLAVSVYAAPDDNAPAAVSADPSAGDGDPPAADAETSLGVRQQRTARLMEDLERRLLKLARSLEGAEPDRSARLVKAFEESKSLRVEPRMREIARLLDLAQLDGATAEQQAVLNDLRSLVEILLSESADRPDNQAEIDALREMRREIQSLLAEQKQLRTASQTLERPEDARSALEKQIAAVEELIRRQSELIRENTLSRAEGATEFTTLASSQGLLKSDTEFVAREMVRARLAAEQAPAAGAPAAPPAASAANPEAAPANPPPANQPSTAQLPGTETPAAKEPPAANESSQAPPPAGNEPPAPPQSAAAPSSAAAAPSAPSNDPNSESAPPAAQALARSTEHQQQAQAQLEQQQPKSAERDQQRALDEMQSALSQLQQELAELRKPSEQRTGPLAQRQSAAAAKTGALGQKAAQCGQGAKPTANPGTCSACSSALAQAQQQMQQAAQCLQQSSQGAGGCSAQVQAEQALQQAQKQIDKRLEELGVKPDGEAIERLETIFREMLAAQQAATAQTADLADQLAAMAGEELRRGDRITLRRLAQEERMLSDRAAHALELIETDGTTISFPIVVEAMRDTLVALADRIDERQLDEPTPEMQRDVERTLEELIEALQVVKKLKPGEAGQGKCKGCKPRLLPDTAELKLLRALQLRINRRTLEIDQARQADPAQAGLHQQLARLTSRQQDVGEMVFEIIQSNRADDTPVNEPFPWLKVVRP